MFRLGFSCQVQYELFENEPLPWRIRSQSEISLCHEPNGARKFALGLVASGLANDVVGRERRNTKSLPQSRPQHALIAHVALEDHKHLAECLSQHVEMTDRCFFAFSCCQQ